MGLRSIGGLGFAGRGGDAATDFRSCESRGERPKGEDARWVSGLREENGWVVFLFDGFALAIAVQVPAGSDVGVDA